jgi:5-formyltetrahydrofolate cyclo-ligase
MKHPKTILRLELVAKRRAIEPEIAEKASLAIAEHFLAIIPPQMVVAGYCPMRGEINIMNLLTKLAERGNKICLPVVMDGKRKLKFLAWSPSEELCAGKFGELCPFANSPELQPDIVIVPLVGFDIHLQRLGYGGGYYDATILELRAINKNVRIIGAAYNMQLVENLPIEIHDEKLDAVITESGDIINF